MLIFYINAEFLNFILGNIFPFNVLLPNFSCTYVQAIYLILSSSCLIA